MLRKMEDTMEDLKAHYQRVKLEHAQERTKEYLEQTGGDDSHGALKELLNRRGAALYLTVLPKDITVTQYAYIEGAHEEDDHDFLDRQRDCMGCPAHGGACDKVNRVCGRPFGKQPMYSAEHNEIAYYDCDKWPLYTEYKELGVMGVPERFRKLDAAWELYRPNDESSQPLVLAWCKQYAKDFKGNSPGAIFEGARGTGKTHMAQAILATLYYRLRRRHICGYLWSTTLLAHTLTGKEANEGDNEALAYRLGRTPLLVLDSFGASVLDSDQRYLLQQLVTQRRTAHLPTIAISRESIESYAPQCGEELVTLLSDDVPRVVFTGPDWRQAHRVVIGAQ